MKERHTSKLAAGEDMGERIRNIESPERERERERESVRVRERESERRK
jgi:hypothetical protein